MEANVATPAALMGDPVRAALLLALLDGRSLPATALAWAAGVSSQVASNHLAKLIAGGLLTVTTQGRHRYYRLAGPDVAHALESLAVLGPPPSRWSACIRPKPVACGPRGHATTIWRDSSASRWRTRWRMAG